METRPKPATTRHKLKRCQHRSRRRTDLSLISWIRNFSRRLGGYTFGFFDGHGSLLSSDNKNQVPRFRCCFFQLEGMVHIKGCPFPEMRKYGLLAFESHPWVSVCLIWWFNDVLVAFMPLFVNRDCALGTAVCNFSRVATIGDLVLVCSSQPVSLPVLLCIPGFCNAFMFFSNDACTYSLCGSFLIRLH